MRIAEQYDPQAVSEVLVAQVWNGGGNCRGEQRKVLVARMSDSFPGVFIHAQGCTC